jgi:hypothetical protein
MPFSEQQTTALVGAKIMGSMSWADLAAGTHFNYSKSPKAIRIFVRSSVFTNHFESLSDDEKVMAASLIDIVLPIDFRKPMRCLFLGFIRLGV